jgi:hypothetical protein
MKIQVAAPKVRMPDAFAPTRSEIILAAVTRRRHVRRRAAARALRSPKLLAPAAVLALGAVAIAASWGRRHRLIAAFADAVEEVADTIEDTAEDVAAAARARESS